MTRSGGITINGKFVGGSLNGVHRTAALFAAELCRRAGPGRTIEMLVPRPVPDDPALTGIPIRVAPGLFGAKQSWEMLSLPWTARRDLLVNFCNLGPILHPRSIVMIHDAQTFLYPGDYSGRQAKLYRLLLPIIGARAARVLTVSEFARGTLAEHGIARAEKIRVVHNGGDHILAVPPERSILEWSGLVPGSYAMAIGTTKRYKNLGLLFDAFRDPALHDLPLVVAGGPPEAAYTAAGLQPPPSARFTGRVDDGELRALYEGARMFLFPSLTEGFGLPPLEAMFCGTPAIVARAGAMPEVCGDAAIQADPGDAGDWRAAIGRLRDDEARAEYAARARARAERFTWTRAGDALWAAVEDLIR